MNSMNEMNNCYIEYNKLMEQLETCRTKKAYYKYSCLESEVDSVFLKNRIDELYGTIDKLHGNIYELKNKHVVKCIITDVVASYDKVSPTQFQYIEEDDNIKINNEEHSYEEFRNKIIFDETKRYSVKCYKYDYLNGKVNISLNEKTIGPNVKLTFNNGDTDTVSSGECKNVIVEVAKSKIEDEELNELAEKTFENIKHKKRIRISNYNRECKKMKFVDDNGKITLEYGCPGKKGKIKIKGFWTTLKKI